MLEQDFDGNVLTPCLRLELAPGVDVQIQPEAHGALRGAGSGEARHVERHPTRIAVQEVVARCMARQLRRREREAFGHAFERGRAEPIK
jgi:hypothetical protein